MNYKRILPLLIIFLSLFTKADAVTIESYTASVEDGISVTFSEPVTTINNGFDYSVGYCAEVMENGDGPLSLKVSGNGTNTIVLKKYFGTFVNGYSYDVTFKATHVTAVSNGEQLSGDLSFSFIMGAGKPIADVQVINFTPQSGERQNGSLNNVTATFSKMLTEIPDTTVITIVNENNHSLKLSAIGMDEENPLGALNINIDPEQMEEEGTTYKCYVPAEALVFSDGSRNSENIVFGEWYIKPSVLSLTLSPAPNTAVESIKTITVSANRSLTFTGDPSTITIKGVMEYQVNTYATCVSATKNNNGSYTLTFDKEVTPEMLAEVETISSSHAQTNNVKVCIPAGVFQCGLSTNNSTEAIYIVQYDLKPGSLSWTFDPADGSEVEALGNMMVSSNEGKEVTTYVIGISVEGANAYVIIPDASAIKLYNEKGASVVNFSLFDIESAGVNRWTLDLGGAPKSAAKEYTLIIPKESIFIYNNVEYYGQAVHPDEDVEATWTITSNNGIDDITTAPANDARWSLSGTRLTTPLHGITVIKGKKFLTR